jgi:hypothetical protein
LRQRVIDLMLEKIKFEEADRTGFSGVVPH